MSLLRVSHLESHSFQLPTTMSDSQSINTSLLEVMISANHEQVIIRNLTDFNLQIICDAWWASMNVGSKHPVAWNYSRHALSWHIYLHCGIHETGSLRIIRIICHPILRHTSEHGTSSMGKHLLAKAQFAKLNELTESEVSSLTTSTVYDTALAILKKQGSHGITIGSSQKKFIFDSLILLIFTFFRDTTL